MPKDEEIRQLLGDPGLSDWFKRALLSALDRDPVDAANEADLLWGPEAQWNSKPG